MCVKQSPSSYVTFDLTMTPTAVCESFQTLRDVFMTECLTAEACGDGCPADAPTTGDACISNDIRWCDYSDAASSTVCNCMGDLYVCN
jgi:hypothetical protein